MTGENHHLAPLLDLPIWCGWGYGDKAPRRPSGRLADVANPRTWSTYPEIARAVARNRKLQGAGIVAGNGVVTFDCDDCFDERGPDQDVADWLDWLDTYAELSPSGSGVRIICRTASGYALPPDHGRARAAIGYKVDGAERTIYVEREFATITGDVLRDLPIREVEPAILDAFVERCLRDRPKTNGATFTPGGGPGMFGDPEHVRAFVEALESADPPLWEAWNMHPDRAPDDDTTYSGWWCSLARKLTVRFPHLSRDDLIQIGHAWADHQDWSGHRIRDLGENPSTAAKNVARNVERGVDLVLETEFQPRGGHDCSQHVFRVQPPALSSEPPKAPPKVDLDDPMFIGPLGDLVRALDPHTEASPAGTLAALLTMVGNHLGRSFYVSVGADQHFPVVHALLVGPSATGRKGTAASNALLCMRELDAEWTQRNVHRSLNSGQGIVETVKRFDREARGPDGTRPGDKRAMFLVAEFGDVLAKATVAGNTLLPTLRSLWDCGDADNTSITRPARVRGASVSLLGMITGEELAELVDPRQLATGTLNRLLMVQVERSKVLEGLPPALAPGLVRPGVERLRRNLEAAQRKSLFGGVRDIGIAIALSAAALPVAAAIKATKETPGRTWVDAGNQRAFVHVLRLALVYAVCDGCSEIEPVHLNAAEAVADLAGQSIRVFATGELQDKIARRILTHMSEDPSEALTRTAISSDVFGRNVAARDLENAIGLLEKLGLLAEVRVSTRGRPRTVYQLTTN